MLKKCTVKTLLNLVQNLYYNDDDSYLFVNCKQELKFKAKTESLVKEKLCMQL